MTERDSPIFEFLDNSVQVGLKFRLDQIDSLICCVKFLINAALGFRNFQIINSFSLFPSNQLVKFFDSLHYVGR